MATSPLIEKTTPTVDAPKKPGGCQWNAMQHKMICHAPAASETAPTVTESCALRAAKHKQGVSIGGDQLPSYPLSSKDLAALQARKGSANVTEVNLRYVSIHGHINHYYHWVHDALLTFYPVFNALAPKRVVVWHGLSFGHFTPLFEAVYNLKVSYYYNQATDCTTVK